jgi:uncharacterized integral membrane protein
MVKTIKAIFLTVLFIFGITFAVENTQPVVLRYYFGLESVPIPAFLLVLFSVLAGVLLTGVAYLVDVWWLKKALKDKEQQIRSLQRPQEPANERQRVGGVESLRQQ